MQPNLISWLAPHRKKNGKVHPTNLRKRFDADREAAELREDWPDNALRHSFGSYHLAKFGNAAALALQMGNSVDVIFKQYRQLVKPAEAKRYWQAKPPAEYGKKIIAFAAAA
jgi:integrase